MCSCISVFEQTIKSNRQKTSINTNLCIQQQQRPSTGRNGQDRFLPTASKCPRCQSSRWGAPRPQSHTTLPPALHCRYYCLSGGKDNGTEKREVNTIIIICLTNKPVTASDAFNAHVQHTVVHSPQNLSCMQSRHIFQVFISKSVWQKHR